MDRQDMRLLARWLALVAGLALLVAAVPMAAADVDWSALWRAPTWTVPIIAAAVLANLLLTAALFHVITRSFDATPQVSFPRMFQLTCASALLNYLPLRPGLFGRAAYLKLRHELPVYQSLLILAVTMVIGGIVLGATAVAVLGAGATWRLTACGSLLAGLLLCSAIAGPLAKRLLQRPTFAAWSWLPLKVADMLVGGVRLWVAFRILGYQLTFEQAIAVGAIRAVGSLVDMLGITPNGLGLREWVIGGTTGLAGIAEGPAGIAASLLDRGVEAAVVVVTGLVSIAQLKDRRRSCDA